MRILKKQKEVPAERPEVSLKDQLEQAVDAAEAYIATIVAREKAASPLQPAAWHELSLRLAHGRDSVRCALSLLEKESNASQR
jgi:hypothetical protein